MRYELFAADELQPGEMRPARAGSVDVVVIRAFDGSFHALRDRCSHQGAALSGGLLQEMIVGDDIGGIGLSDKMIVRCPWHGLEFDVCSGRCPADPNGERVRSYSVDVEGDVVVLER